MSDEEGVITKRRVIQTVKWMTIGLALICLLNLAYLPGPDFLYEFGWGIWLITLFLVPLSVLLLLPGIAMLLADLVFRKRISRACLFLIFIPVFLFLTVFLSHAVFERAAIRYTIHESTTLIEAIEKFKSEVGTYPDSLTELTHQYIETIPTPIAIGIKTFEYIRTDSTYEVRFAIGYTDFLTSDVTYDPATYHATKKRPGWFSYDLPRGWEVFGRNT